ncbi:hypothetical protein [Halomonas sp. SpR8]|uniref:hypothetical protein n=1 Tax=Halomonas sp. SpR8 TaxID=3050463 RepID=UPI0027E4916D|nr:hypothetical protein [Halomonas sp. SpR8]MDQ7730724.1 hypothetical protein [Halomonas sp. SpR8]
MGTWRTFNVGSDPKLLDARTEVVKAFFEHGGSLIKNLKRRNAPLPEWAKTECGCDTWADFLLKFIVSHPAITCAIPATTQVEHMHENMRAGHTPMPSPDARQRMATYRGYVGYAFIAQAVLLVVIALVGLAWKSLQSKH